MASYSLMPSALRAGMLFVMRTGCLMLLSVRMSLCNPPLSVLSLSSSGSGSLAVSEVLELSIHCYPTSTQFPPGDIIEGSESTTKWLLSVHFSGQMFDHDHSRAHFGLCDSLGICFEEIFTPGISFMNTSKGWWQVRSLSYLHATLRQRHSPVN